MNAISTLVDPPHAALPLPHVIAGGRDVHVRDLTITYERGPDSVTPVAGLHLYAPSSRVTALVGRSGSGKTSILSCIAAMLRPANGAIWVGGLEVTQLGGKALDAYRRTHVGVIHQAYNLIPSLSALEKRVGSPLSHRRVAPRCGGTRVNVVERPGSSGLSAKQTRCTFGGQQQRVAVARALATNPSVVLADEPTAHLDGSSVADVRDLLRMIADSGRTVILSTHDDRLLGAADQTIHLGADLRARVLS